MVDIRNENFNPETLYVCCKLWQLRKFVGKPPDPDYVEQWGMTRQDVACMSAYIEYERKRRKAKD